MRPDVKLGVIVSVLVVSIGGVYYMMRDRSEAPVTLADGSGAVDRAKSAVPPANKTRPSSQHKPTRRSPKATTKRATSAKPKVATRNGARKTTAHRTGGSSAAKRPGRRGIASNTPATKPKGLRTTRPGASKPVPSASKTAMAARRPGASKKTSPAATTRRSPGTTRRSNQVAGQSGSTAPSARVAKANTARVGVKTAIKGNTGLEKQQASNKHAQAPAGQPGTTSHRFLTGTPRPTAQSGRKATPGSAGEPTAVESHRVQPGDTFTSIAMSYYGSEKYTRFLISSNPAIGDPRSLQIGDTVRIPPLPSGRSFVPSGKSQRPASSTGTGRTYRVQSGDSFYAIARDVLGDSSRWNELFQLNKDAVGGDPRKLKIGQVLRLPER